MKILITGSCGFIGSHLAEYFLKLNHTIIGIDNLNNFIYDSKFKLTNLNILKKYSNYIQITDDIDNNDYIFVYRPDIIIHLAAYANVRKSEEFPDKYIRNNSEVTCKLLQQISILDYKPLFIYASSSSVYGKNKKVPFSEIDSLDNIQSAYALSKKMCEELVNMYCRVYNFKAVGLRFFTVYGPRGRPDMAVFKFLKNINEEKEIIMYGDGSMERDYTYIDDIIYGIVNVCKLDLQDGEHRIYNLGNNSPVKLKDFIKLCEKITNKIAIINNKKTLLGDVPITYANIDKAIQEINYNPKTKFEDGLNKTFNWIKTI
jgi:UDP-glucuronate 4-epimerase